MHCRDNTSGVTCMLMQWVYSQYFSIYSQYLSYFTTVLILLTSASALSLLKSHETKSTFCCKLLLFISFILAIIDIYIVFDIYDNLRSMILLMADDCSIKNQVMSCITNPQNKSSYLKIATIIAIISFIMLLAGNYFKNWRNTCENK